MICELKQLETLELYGRTSESSGLNNLYQLEKLKRLAVGHYVCDNILDHLKFGVFNDLEELDAAFEGASVESFQEMKQITPNLKKISIHSHQIYCTVQKLSYIKIPETLSANSGFPEMSQVRE
jgi:hypothetical protein